MPIGVVMTRMPNIITLQTGRYPLLCGEQMMRHEVDSLPVVRPVDGDEQQLEVIGRISKTTLAKVFVGAWTTLKKLREGV